MCLYFVCCAKVGRTALIVAAESDYLEVVRLLVQAGADINIRDKVKYKRLYCLY